MKKASWKRTLRIFGAAVAGILLVVAGAAWWLLSTQAGARWAIQRLGVVMKGSLDVEGVEGPLRGPLTLRGVTYKSPTLNARVDTVRLDWRLWRLIRKQLDITQLAADGVHIRTVPEKTRKERERLPDIHLPVNVIVRSATVRGIEVAGPDGTNPTRLDSIDLATRAIGEVVRVDRLSIAAPAFAASASGRVQPQGAYPVDLKLDWWVQPAGSPRYAGNGNLTGTLEKLGVLQHLTSPFPARLDATLTAPLRDLVFSARLAFSKVRTRAIRADAPPAQLSGTLKASGKPDRFTARGGIDADVAVNQLGRVHADLDISRADDDWQLRSVVLRFPGTPSEISASGMVRLVEPGPKLNLELDWQRISWPLRGKPLATSKHGQATLSGTPDAYALRLDAQITGPGLPTGAWQLVGSGSRKGLALSSFRGALMEGAIAGSGRFGWSPRLTWELGVRGENLNPASVDARYPGRLSFEARTNGRMTPAGAAGTVEVPELSGMLRGRPIQAAGLVDLDGRTITLRRASLALADTRAQASGSVGPTWNLQGRIDSPDLQPILADASGSLHASGSLTGPRACPRVRAAVTGQALALGPRKVSRLSLDADVDLAPSGNMRMDLSAGGVVPAAGVRPIESLTVTGRGTRAAHTLTVAAKNADGSLALALGGGLSDDTWRGELRKLDLQGKETGAWTLASAAPLSASRAEVSLREFCWVSGGARLCGDVDWRKTGTSAADASIVNLPFSLLAPWLPSGVRITGGLNGTIDGRLRPGGVLLARVELTAGPGELRFPFPPAIPSRWLTATRSCVSRRSHPVPRELSG